MWHQDKIKMCVWNKISLSEILEGKHPSFQTNKLRLRLLKEGVMKYICSSCGLSEWMNKPIPLQLDHINGVSTDHRLVNLRLLCPNCHAQTDTWCGKNKGNPLNSNGTLTNTNLAQ